MTKRTMVALLAGSVFGGCLNGYPEDPHAPGAAEPEPDSYDDVGDFDSGSEFAGALDITGAHLSGDMGDVHGFSGDATSTSATQEYDYASIILTTTNETDGYSAMTILDIEGGVDHPAFVPGANLHFDGYEGAGGMFIYVTGCSGPREGSWMFDSGADDVTVNVQAGSAEDRIRVDFDAAFDGNGTTHGSFEVTVPQA